MDLLACWMEWKARCAAALCDESTRRSLQKFAHTRFLRFYPRSIPSRVLPHRENGLPAVDAWHLFETHLITTQTKQGKRFKDWLYARAVTSEDSPLNVI